MLGTLAAMLLMSGAPERPRDVWIFRSVLDKHARMLTIALHDGLWVAYDATNCGLYKAWDGDVAFEGAVYTAVHGPQPRSVGKTYVRTEPGAPMWFTRKGNRIENAKMVFGGYRLVEGHPVLIYDVKTEAGTVRIEESPEFLPTNDGKITLERRFHVVGKPAKGIDILVSVADEAVAAPNLKMITAPSDLVVRTAFTKPTPSVPMVPVVPKDTVEAPKAPVKIDPIAIHSLSAKPKIDAVADPLWGSLSATTLIKRFAGPAKNADDLRAEARVGFDRDGIYFWVDVADNKVVAEDGVTVRLGGKQFTFSAKDDSNRQPEAIYKVKASATGYQVEGHVPWAVTGKTYSAGQEVPFDLFVTDSDGGSVSKIALGDGGPDRGIAKLVTATDEGEPESRQPRENGVSVRVYFTGVGSDRIPELAANQTPNVNFVAPTVNFNSDAQLGGFGDHFVVHITGFLKAPTTGKYEFSLNSDDGSKLWIDDKLVIDHDGLHSAGDPKTGEVDLTEGDHKIRVEFYDNEVDCELYLGWKRPGATETETIPTEFLSTPRGEVRVTSPGRKLVVNATEPNPPGDRRPLEGVHPSYDLATIRPLDFKPRVGGIDFLKDGRMVLCTWDADGAVYILDKVRSNQKGEVTVKRIAQGLAEPLGIKVVGNRVFVLQKQELTELVDLNGDEVTDEYRAIANGWGVTDNFHEFAFGLVYRDGFFYANLATAINPGGTSTRPQNPDRGKTVKIGLDGHYEFITHGLRTPNGVGFGFNNEIFLTDNQGDWLPSSKLLHVKPGAFYGNRSVDPEGTAKETEQLPVVWLPQGEIGNSPSQPAKLNDGPYKNQMILGDVTYGGLQRVFVEEVGGQFQGSVFRMTQGLEAGVNRIVWGPDGALYVGGIGSTGNWGQTGKERFGLQRLKYNGKSTFEMLAVRAKANGFEVEFTEPLAEGHGEDASSYNVDRFRYVPTEQYGGPKIDETELAVRSVTLSKDRKKAFLQLDGLKPGHVVHLRLDNNLKSSKGNALWTTETWYTLNLVPKERGTVAPSKVGLTPEEIKAGFVPLFDGKDTSAWIGYRKNVLPKGWHVVDGTLMYDPKVGDGGDIMTKEKYGDFELRMEWKVSPGGNSGLMYRVDDSESIPWLTGPEMQVLDNARHADGKNPLTSAGADYAMYPTDQSVFRGANQWNEARLIIRGNDVEHWLNGKRVVKYTLGSPDWEKKWQESKFRDQKRYGRVPVGNLVLQDHGDAVWFRNIRILKLK